MSESGGEKAIGLKWPRPGRFIAAFVVIIGSASAFESYASPSDQSLCDNIDSPAGYIACPPIELLQLLQEKA